MIRYKGHNINLLRQIFDEVTEGVADKLGPLSIQVVRSQRHKVAVAVEYMTSETPRIVTKLAKINGATTTVDYIESRGIAAGRGINRERSHNG